VSYTVVFSSAAQSQLEELEDYLALRFYPGNAERYVERIATACISLGLAPHRGTQREDLGTGVRMIGFESRVAIYSESPAET
jgi:toxin ParE1/3/4